MSLLVHDSRAVGHHKWTRAALEANQVSGVVLSPFCTPSFDKPSNPSVATLVASFREVAPDARILLDPCTHGALMAGTNLWAHYNTWTNLWPSGMNELKTTAQIAEHVGAVFNEQQALKIPTLAPTVEIDRPDGEQADLALKIALEARRQDPNAIQSLVGRRSFWAAGVDLDAFVGRLAQLRAKQWLLTPLRDAQSYPPDLTDYSATAGLLRTVDSLSRRAAVAVGHSDYSGIPAIAAGASAIGAGWYMGQRVCSPDLFRDAGRGSNVLHSPHPGLWARFSTSVAEELQDAAPRFAASMREQFPIPVNNEEARSQHLDGLRTLVSGIIEAGAKPVERVPYLREQMRGLEISWLYAVSLGVSQIDAAECNNWFRTLRNGFERYAAAEKL